MQPSPNLPLATTTPSTVTRQRHSGRPSTRSSTTTPAFRTGPYNREHSWPNSYGYPDDGSTNYPYTDCHALFLADSSYNSSRGNTLYRYCSASCTEKPTDVNNGQGGGVGVFPGNSNWRTGSGSTGTWETWIRRRGDVARALFYLDIRYEGGMHSITLAAEPDLILTDNTSLIQTTGTNAPVAYMGLLTDLLAWHYEDPVSVDELRRNNVVASFQGNRNPFVDRPEWVGCLFLNLCATVFRDGFEFGGTGMWSGATP